MGDVLCLVLNIIVSIIAAMALTALTVFLIVYLCMLIVCAVGDLINWVKKKKC